MCSDKKKPNRNSSTQPVSPPSIPIELQPGDVFLVRGHNLISKAILAAEKIVNKDGKARYSHAGLILDPSGTTYESLWHVESKNLFRHYAGKEVFIARHECMNPDSFQKAYRFIKVKHDGDFYPMYRLLFHISPIFSKTATEKVVCSELVARFLNYLELFPYYNGANPDNLHDFICWGIYWQIVFVGQLPKLDGAE